VLEEAPFDAVILWLEALHRDHGLAVTTLDLTRRPAPGTVNASLTLERPMP
jgi:type II secretory pathway component PulM